MSNNPIWQELQQIPREDWPKWLKKNHPEVWTRLAWQKVNDWRDNQKTQSAVLGDTPDYDRNLFTLDDRANEMVYLAFRKYWEDGLIYKSVYLVNWSVGLQTALSDVAEDIGHEERIDPFVKFEYQAKNWELKKDIDTSGSLIDTQKLLAFAKTYLKPCATWKRLQLGTVRMETKFTDVSVAMHPQKFSIYFNLDLFEQTKDGFDINLAKEFLELIRQEQITILYDLPPLPSGDLQLVFSDKVDPTFGTGIVKITPGHDLFDFELFNELVKQKRLPNKPIQTCIGRDGKLKEEFCGEFSNLTVEQARPLIIKKLIETNFIPKKINPPKIEKTELEPINKQEFEQLKTTADKYKWLAKNYPEYEIDWNYKHNVVICDRSKTVVEPLISEEFFLDWHKAV